MGRSKLFDTSAKDKFLPLVHVAARVFDSLRTCLHRGSGHQVGIHASV